MDSVRRLRKRHGLSMVALAEESGVSPEAIWKIETGKVSPQGRTLRKIAGVLGVTVAELYAEEEPPLVPGPLHELSAERRRALLGLVAVKDLPPSPGGEELREYAEIAREMSEYGFPPEAFRRWFHEANVEDVRSELLPDGETLEARAMQLQLEM